MSSLSQLADLVAPERPRPFTRTEYQRMVEEGHFRDERIELLQGVIVQMTPQGTRHAATIQRLTHALVTALGERAMVRVQLPLTVSEDSLPEPDVAAVPPGDYDRAHPTAAYLVVEVAETSLNKDRLLKADLYAAAGVREYWIVDVAAGTIEVCSDPVAGHYARRAPGRPGEALRLAAFPEIEIRVADIVR